MKIKQGVHAQSFDFYEGFLMCYYHDHPGMLHALKDPKLEKQTIYLWYKAAKRQLKGKTKCLES